QPEDGPRGLCRFHISPRYIIEIYSSSRGDGCGRRLHCALLVPDSAHMLPFDADVRSRRTHKVFGREPVPRSTLDELFELARWAPNHHLTQPWRFRVVGPQALAALKAATDDGGVKLQRAPTLIVASVVRQSDPVADQEDLCAAACACFIVLTAAHVRGLAGYWRTPAVLRTD